MSSQDDLGMLWYGVSGVSFNPTDPAEVMLNTGITAPLLSDHPRALVAPQVSQTSLGSHPQQGTISYGDPSISQHNQMLYDPQTGDFINQTDYMYEPYDGYEEDATVSNGLGHHNQQLVVNHQPNPNLNEEETNSHPKTKKPKVHQHPALKLKTPIAYQKDTDLNAIPIMKEGMAVCEKCGAIGVKHAFYGKERKYCSLACARPPMSSANPIPKASSESIKATGKVETATGDQLQEGELNTDLKVPTSCHSAPSGGGIQSQEDAGMASSPTINSPYEFDSQSKDSTDTFHQQRNNQNEFEEFLNETFLAKGSQNSSSSASSSSPSHRGTPTYLPVQNSKEALNQSFDWEQSYLGSEDFIAGPVQSFKHAPMSECWEQISPGMKVEVSCGEESLMKDSFWVATLIALCGYKAKLRFEGFVDDNSKDFWVDLCSEEVHPVGWCATQEKPLIPPKTIQFKYKDWKEFLMKRLTGARTLPTNFHSKVLESLKSRFRPGLNLEVVDKNRIAQMRVATVTRVIGKRLHLRYHGAPPDDNGFWCHEDAAIIHPVGWSREVGHEIVASQSYHEKCLEVAYDPDDATSDLFIYPQRSTLSKCSDQFFSEGMKLEAIDPLNLSTICVATVMKVLSHNYLMIRIDSYDNDNTCSDWFCYHSASTSIFPAGFCEMNGIHLTPPRGYEGQFSWYNYLTKTQAIAAPPALFSREIPNHGFKVGMSIEAADLMDPRLVCVATVKEVKGRLLKVHFDGWENDFDQWVDCQSPDIYPVGWCNLVSYKLEGPRLSVPTSFVQRKKARGRGGRKGRPFGSRRGSFVARGVENATPLTLLPTGGQVFPPTTNTTCKRDLSYGANEGNNYSHRGRRGRPRKTPLRNSNHDPLQGHQTRPARATRTSLPSYVQSEDDISDETSSGVASLAGSENSSEAWDMEQYNINPMQEVEGSANEHQLNYPPIKTIDNQDFMNQLTPLPNDTGYRENSRTPNLNFKPITDESVLFGEENPNLDNFLTPGERLVEHHTMPLSENSSDFQVTSSFDVQMANQSLALSSNCGTSLTPVTSSCEEPPPQPAVPPQPIISVPMPSPTLEQEMPMQGVNTFSAIELHASSQFIPRIIDNSSVVRSGKVQPKLWSHFDVATFLKANDCGAYCENFIAKRIDGTRLLNLAQNEVMELTGMKVGPSLKIHDLIQQLLAIVNPAQARYQATLLKRGLAFGKS